MCWEYADLQIILCVQRPVVVFKQIKRTSGSYRHSYRHSGSCRHGVHPEEASAEGGSLPHHSLLCAAICSAVIMGKGVGGGAGVGVGVGASSANTQFVKLRTKLNWIVSGRYLKGEGNGKDKEKEKGRTRKGQGKGKKGGRPGGTEEGNGGRLLDLK